MTTNKCLCGAPTRDANLCTQCVDYVRDDLRALKSFLPELGVTVSRQDRIGHTSEHRPSTTTEREYWDPQTTLVSTPAQIGFDAADVLADAKMTLTSWTRELARTHRIHIYPRRPEFAGPYHGWCMHYSCREIRSGLPSDQVITAWLLAHLDTVRVDDRAQQFRRDIGRLRNKVEQTIDRKTPGVYAGKCDATVARTWLDDDGVIRVEPSTCGTQLMARLEDKTVSCPACGEVYQVAERLDAMLEQARDARGRPAEIASALAHAGRDITLERLRGWISKDKAAFDELQPPGRHPRILMVTADVLDEQGDPLLEPDLDDRGRVRVNRFGQPIMRPVGRPLYRYGDVMDRVDSIAKWRADVQARKANA